MRLTKVALAVVTALGMSSAYAAQNEFFQQAGEGVNQVTPSITTKLMGTDTYKDAKHMHVGLSYERGLSKMYSIGLGLDYDNSDSNTTGISYMDVFVKGNMDNGFHWGLDLRNFAENDVNAVAMMQYDVVLGYAHASGFSGKLVLGMDDVDGNKDATNLHFGYEHDLSGTPVLWKFNYNMAGSDDSNMLLGARARWEMGSGELLVDVDYGFGKKVAGVTFDGAMMTLGLGYRMNF